jgi:general secretion pathway protein A
MYCNFFGISEKPFDVTPDPAFLYLSPGHQEMLASLIYGIRERRGFITIVGEVGTGKTTLLNAVLDRLDEKTKVAFIFNTDVTFEHMLVMALVEFGVARPEENLPKVEALGRLNDFAIRQLAKGVNVVLIVDEAQNLDDRCLESLRLLSNLETRKHKLVQIILSGQPELDFKLGRPELRQLAQRISLKRYITPLSEKETYAYIQHRLVIAGYKGPSLFSHEARQLIWKYSGGVPRKINILCDNAFLIGYGLRRKKIKAPVVEEAIKDLSWSPFSGNIETRFVPPLEEKTPQIIMRAPHPRFAVILSLMLAVCLIFAVGLNFQYPRRKLQEWRSLFYHTSIMPARPVSKLNIPDQSLTLPEPEPEPYEEKTELQPEATSNCVVAERGDYLSLMIKRTYGAYDEEMLSTILRENPDIRNPDLILVGQAIKLPLLKDNP